MSDLIDRAREQIERKAVELIMNWLTVEKKDYRLLIPNNMGNLMKVVRVGDVILVEGNRRFSRLVMKVTNSVWSHSAMYVGRGMIVEADENGVALNPLARYEHFNIRLCRPVGISGRRLHRVAESVKSNVGKSYDTTNLIKLLQAYLFDNKEHDRYLGHPGRQQEICSGIIASVFEKEGFQVRDGYDPSQVVPRDFDLSPNFRIIKFNKIEAPLLTRCREKLKELLTGRKSENVPSMHDNGQGVGGGTPAV